MYLPNTLVEYPLAFLGRSLRCDCLSGGHLGAGLGPPEAGLEQFLHYIRDWQPLENEIQARSRVSRTGLYLTWPVPSTTHTDLKCFKTAILPASPIHCFKVLTNLKLQGKLYVFELSSSQHIFKVLPCFCIQNVAFMFSYIQYFCIHTRVWN